MARPEASLGIAESICQWANCNGKEERNQEMVPIDFVLETRRVEAHFMRWGKERNPADLRDFKSLV